MNGRRGVSYGQPGRALPVLALLWAIVSAAAAHAGETNGGVRLKPELYLTGIANYVGADGNGSSHDTVAVTGELTFFSRGRPYWGGPFIDYRYSSNGRFDRNVNLGAYFRYNLSRWDATAWLFVNRSPGNDDTWLYATRLRYRIAANHKLGGEALAPIREGADRPKLMLGYYGSISESLSLNVLAGTHTGGSPDILARLELVWRIR